jgi:hypothetical protein
VRNEEVSDSDEVGTGEHRRGIHPRPRRRDHRQTEVLSHDDLPGYVTGDAGDLRRTSRSGDRHVDA